MFCFKAENTPSGTPTSTAQSIANIPSFSETGKCSLIDVVDRLVPLDERRAEVEP